MKNNRSVKKIKFVLIVLASLLLPFSVNAADVYYVKTNKSNPLSNLRASAYFYNPAYTTTTYTRTALQCTSQGGTFDSNDCVANWYRYKYNCKYTPVTLDYCQLRYSWQMTPTGYYVSKTYVTDADAQATCANRTKVIYDCTLSSGKVTQLTRTYELNEKTRVDCDLNSYASNVVTTIGGYQYAKGDYSSSCNKGLTACRCDVAHSATSGYTVNGLSTYDANVDGVAVYCVNPGLKFPPSTEPYSKESASFNLNNCSGATGTLQYACGVAAMVTKAAEMGVDGDYATMLTALRLWSSENGFGDGNNNSNDELGISELLVSKSPLYSNTAKLVMNNNYAGSIEKPADVVIYAKNETGLTQIQNAIALYKEAKSGTYKSWSPDIKNGSVPFDIDESGRFNFTITANFDDENTSEIYVKSLTSGVTLTVSSKGMCGEKYCIEVQGTIAGFSRKNCNVSSVNYEIGYRDKRDISAALMLLKPTNNPSKYQKFIYYDKSKVGNPNKVEKTIQLNCPPEFECPQPQIIYDQTSGCHNEGTTGELIDPTIECILNVEKLNTNYDFTDLYVHSTGFGHTNDYCEVKCRETIKYEMHDQTNAASVRFIKYTNGSHASNALLATISGERDCVADIDYDKWKEDFIKANELVRTNWNTYKYYENLHVYTEPRPKEEECVYNYPECDECCNRHCCDGYYKEADPETGTGGGWVCTDHCGYPGPGAECDTRADWLYWDPKDYAVTNEDGSVSISQSSGQDTEKECSGSTCGGKSGCYVKPGNPNKYEGAYLSAKQAYEDAVDARAELVGYIQDCNLYSSFSVGQVFRYSRNDNNSVWYEATEGYDFDPNYEYEYEDTYTSKIRISKDTELTRTPSPKYCVGCEETAAMGGSTLEELKYWSCSGTQTGAICKDIKIKVPKNTMALTEKITKETYYWQSVDFASSVPDGEIVEIVSSADSNNLSLSDKNIFPLEIGKLSGVYYANAIHGNVGDTDRKQPIKYETGDQGAEYIKNYECDFIVDNEITIYPDSDIVCPGCNGKYGYYFRQIDLTNMFPSGVKTGTWSTVQAQNLISTIESKGEDIYKGTPKYEFVITPGNIRKIKEYNREMEAFGKGYNDFNLDCNCQIGICYCHSIFLDSISDDGPYSDLVTVYKKDGIEYRSGR